MEVSISANGIKCWSGLPEDTAMANHLVDGEILYWVLTRIVCCMCSSMHVRNHTCSCAWELLAQVQC